jgi:release factor glutamine methyltransferase
MGAVAVAGTAGAALQAAIARLDRAGIPEPRADAEVLLAHVLGTTRPSLVTAAHRTLPAAAAVRLETLLARRAAAREPVHHLIEEREFWSLPFAVDRRVLIPRPETELVVETACRVAPHARRILDVGTGSGAIAVALACELPTAEVWASELDPSALALARRNVARHAPRIRLVQADLVAPFRAAAFDLIVANPPYVADVELEGLAPEVRDHEPRLALAGGADGLAVLRRLVALVPPLLVPGGWLVVEMGAGQGPAVRVLLARDERWGEPRTYADLAGVERVVAVERRGTWTRS